MTSDPDIRLAARHELWRRGILNWKLDATQKKIYEAIQKGKRKHLLLCARRLGKSFIMVVAAMEHALQKPNARVSFAAPTGKDASEIVSDLAVTILEDCPDDIRPEYHAATREFRFHNGSAIRFAGLNAEHAQQLRGRAATLFVIDELALVDDLSHAVSDIALPMTLTTGGRLLFATTPARSQGHYSSTLIRKMQADGEVSKFTILDNVRVSDDIKAEYLVEAGENPERVRDILAGRAKAESTTALREYFCEEVTDAATMVVPEFTTAAQAEIVLADYPIAPYRDLYVSCDPGMVDQTGILFAWYDFLNKKLVLEDELVLRRAATDDIGEAIKAKEEQLWGGRQPLLRILDVDLRLMDDLRRNHGLIFQASRRADSQGAIDTVRSFVRRRELVIDPKCTSIIRQLRTATWDRKGRDFERSTDDGHYDLLASLKYLCREVVRNRSPYPSWWQAPGFHTHSNYGPRKIRTVFTDTPLGRKLSKKWG